MARVLVPLAEGFEELEAITIVDLLRRGGVEVVTAGLAPGPVRASRGTVVQPDAELGAVGGETFDMVVLPGGMPGAENLRQDPRVLDLLRRHAAQGRHTAAICAAPMVLAEAGLLEGKLATSYPGFLDRAGHPREGQRKDPVVCDGLVITSRGPGTAMDFALTLLETLCGADSRRQVEAGLQRPAALS